MSNELKLGIFVIIGLIAVLLTIMLLGNYSLTSKYVVNTYFDNTAGLPKKAKVKISGVDVGNIKDIVLEDGKAKVILVIDRKIKLYSDATAKIVSMGIIGTKYVEITPGTPTNKVIEIFGVDIDRIINGRIVEHCGADTTFDAFWNNGLIKPV